MTRKKNGVGGSIFNAIAAEADMSAGEDDLQAAVPLAAETLTGDLRDFILDRLRHEQNKRPWHERSEAEQRDTVHQVEAAASDIVRRAIELIAAAGQRTITATLEQVTVKDGLKATLSMSRFDEERHNLIDACGKAVLIVVADPAEFTGERAPVEIVPDQAEMLGDAAMAVHSDGDGALPFH